MKKVLNKMAVLLALSSQSLPLIACAFNRYVTTATNAVIGDAVNQTLSVVKALIMSKEKDTDTAQTISDIFSEFANSSIKNQTSDIDLKTYEDFEKHWGFEGIINTNGIGKDYFRASGTGELSKQVKKYKDLNNIFDKLKLILGINVADNSILYNMLINNSSIKKVIKNFLNETKKTNPDELPSNFKDIIITLKDIVIGKDWKNPNKNTFQENVIEPLSSLLNYLVEGWWAPNTPTPPKIDGQNNPIKDFMNQWKDKDNKPYSQWHNGNDWSLDIDNYKNWNQTNYNFYRSGVLFNYLFYKIGKDYQITNSDADASLDYQDRYLGDIIGDHAGFNGLDFPGLIKDLAQYLPYLLKNPHYIILIGEAIIPFIKQWGLEMSDITKGAKNLTFGNIYPTNDNINSYNVLDILNNIDHLLNHPKKIEEIIKSLIGWAPENSIGQSFTYDIKILFYPLGKIIKGDTFIPITDKEKQDLVTSVMNYINSDTVRNTFKNILNVFHEWIKQYNDKNQGIDLNLINLKDFLLNNDNGLITAINRDIIPILYSIFIDPKPLDDAKYLEFYESIGGKLPNKPNEAPPKDFKNNSLLSIIKNKISNTNEPLGQIVAILFGNSSENISGILNFITKSNNQWIYDNYNKFFDIDNDNSEIYNETMSTSIENNIISDTLSYNFNYKINNNIYSFLIKCKSYDKKDSFTGTKNFYFTDIILLELTNIKLLSNQN
ncbi:MAG: hypothetical protein ACRC8P_00415 [Spiroplasma sp.]